jgi:hypothetical protein
MKYQHNCIVTEVRRALFLYSFKIILMKYIPEKPFNNYQKKKYFFAFCLLVSISVSPGWLCSKGIEVQKWKLTSNGQEVIVEVKDFANSGDFVEKDRQAEGWFFTVPACPGGKYKIPAEGNIFRTNGGDRWDFNGLAGSGCGWIWIGTGTGIANGKFPDATYVSGTITGTFRSGTVTTNTTNQWEGRKIE